MRKFTAFLAVLLLVPFLMFPQVKSGAEKNIVITDSTGNIIRLDSIPERITFVGRASIMVADALYMFPEASSRIVGVGFTNQGNGNFTRILDPAYESKIQLDHSSGPEQIAVTRPDLVILKNYLKDSLGNAVNKLGVPVLYLNLETPTAFEDDIRILGQVYGNPGRASEIISYYRKESEAITQKTAGIDKKPDILFLYHSTRDGAAAFNVPPSGWIQTKMVEMAGGNPVWAGSHPGGGWSKVNLEQIASWDPDQIYVVAYKEEIGAVLESMYSSPEWKEFRAVRNRNLKAFPVDFYSWDQPDSRWILGLEWLAKQMNPGLFQGLDIKEKAREFYLTIYSMTENQFNKEIRSRLGW